MDEPVTYQVGDARVPRILEMDPVTLDAVALIPDWNAGLASILAQDLMPAYLDETGAKITLSNHSWLVQTARGTVLVDAGAGNGKTRAMAMFDHLDTPFLDRLAAAGVRPEDVDHVLLTHLHVDHVGWNTRMDGGRWRSTFPNARYVMSKVKQEANGVRLDRLGPDAPETQAYADSVVPILDRADLVGPRGGEVLEGFTFLPTPGHSPGHMTIALRSGGAHALFAGDVMHHPVQAVVPGWSSIFSEDPEAGCASRLRVLEMAAESGAPVFSTHFAGSSAGRVLRSGTEYR